MGQKNIKEDPSLDIMFDLVREKTAAENTNMFNMRINEINPNDEWESYIKYFNDFGGNINYSKYGRIQFYFYGSNKSKNDCKKITYLTLKEFHKDLTEFIANLEIEREEIVGY